MVTRYGQNGLKMPAPLEEEEQRRLIRWAAMAAGKRPELRMLYAVPNGGIRDIVTARKLKETGTKKGVPDLCLAWPSYGYHGLYIEMKKLIGGKTTPEQDEWIRRLNDAGYKAVVCHGWMAAMEEIKSYLGGEW